MSYNSIFKGKRVSTTYIPRCGFSSEIKVIEKIKSRETIHECATVPCIFAKGTKVDINGEAVTIEDIVYHLDGSIEYWTDKKLSDETKFIE